MILNDTRKVLPWPFFSSLTFCRSASVCNIILLDMTCCKSTEGLENLMVHFPEHMSHLHEDEVFH
jgi:hypothetical protein